MELRKNTAVSQPFVIFSKISARNHERFQLKAGLSDWVELFPGPRLWLASCSSWRSYKVAPAPWYFIATLYTFELQTPLQWIL